MKKLPFLFTLAIFVFFTNTIYAQMYNAGPDREICTNSMQLEAASASSGYIGTWSIESGGCDFNNINLPNALITNVVEDSTVLIWTVTNGTNTYYDNVIITNNQVSTAQIDDDEEEICVDSCTIYGNEPDDDESGLWNTTGGTGNITTPENYVTEVTNIALGVNTFQWEHKKGNCTSIDNIVITNNYIPPVQTNDDDDICNDSYTIYAGLYNNTTGLWSLIEGYGDITSPEDYLTEVTNLDFGANTFQWELSNGICRSSDNITITNNSVTASAGQGQDVCTDEAQMQATNPVNGTGTWTVVYSLGTPDFEDENNPTTNVSNLGNGYNSFLWTVDFEECSENSSVVIYNNKVTIANAGEGRTICENNINLSGNNSTYGTGTWSVILGTGIIENSNNYNTAVTDLSEGVNKFRWTIVNTPCSSYDEVEFFYKIVTTDAGEDEAVCSSEYQLSATQSVTGTGVWEAISGYGIFDNETLYNTTVRNMLQGENTFLWTATEDDCSASATVTITNDNPSQASVISYKEICTDYTQINANEPVIGSGTWSTELGHGIFSHPNNNATNISEIYNGENIYRWTITNNDCSFFDEIIVENNSIIADAGGDQTTCGTEGTLNGNQPEQGVTGLWTIVGDIAVIENNTIYNTNVTGLDNGDNVFNWTLNKVGCSSTDQVIVVNDLYYASASIIGPDEICIDYSSISGNQHGNGGDGVWEIVSGNGIFDNSNDNNTFVRNLELGSNIIKWTLSKGDCYDYDTIEITTFNVSSFAGEEQNVCVNYTTMQADEIANNSTGLWTLLSGDGTIQDPSSNISEVTDLAPGINIFRWTVSGYNCVAESDVIVINRAFNVSAGLTQNICETSTTLEGSPSTSGYGYWSVIEGTGVFTDISSSDSEVTDILNNSENIYMWTVARQYCSASDSVYIYNDLISADAGADQFLCISSTVLEGNEPLLGTGEWTTTVGGGYITEPNNPESTVTDLALMTNEFKWSISNLDCISDDYVNITRDTVIASAGINQPTCNDYINLNGYIPQNNGYGIWEVIEGTGIIQTPSLYNTLVTDLQQGNNIFEWTVFENGCFSSGDEVSIINNSFDADAGEDQILPYLITTTTTDAVLPDGGSGVWSIAGGTGTVVNWNIPNTEITDMDTGINSFMWYVEANDCSSVDILNITVINFDVYAGEDKNICLDSTLLNANDEEDVDMQWWSIIQGSGTFDNISSAQTMVRNIPFGENIYRWSVTINGITLYDELTIVRDFANAGEDQHLIDQNYSTLNANQPLSGFSGQWSIISGNGVFTNSLEPNTAFTNIGIGENILEWTVSAEYCSISDFMTIIYDSTTVVENIKNTECYIYPNPNNGHFRIIIDERSNDYEIKINDISGKIIYQSKYDNSEIDISNQKDGIYFVKIISDNKEYIRRVIIK